MHYAATTYSYLKAQGLATWARVKGTHKPPFSITARTDIVLGHGEYFIWATLPKEAILHTFTVADIWRLAEDATCETLVCPTAFELHRKTGAVAAAIKERTCLLNVRIASAMGRLGKLFFGSDRTGVHDRHISEFVARIVDGFAVEKHPATDIQSMSSIAAGELYQVLGGSQANIRVAFAVSFGTHPLYTHQQVMGAFLDGVEEGIASVLHWSRSKSRSGGKRRR